MSEMITASMVIGAVRGAVAQIRNVPVGSLERNETIKPKEVDGIIAAVSEIYDMPPPTLEGQEPWTIETLGRHLWEKSFKASSANEQAH